MRSGPSSGTRARGNERRDRRLTGLAAGMAVALSVGACGAKLPEPDSPGAKLYASRCNSCHRVFAPTSLKFEMWKVQVDRMQGEMVRHGLPPLTPQERDLVLDYLKRHSA